MTEVIVAVAGVVTAGLVLAAAWVSWRSSRAARRQVQQVRLQVEQVHLIVNSQRKAMAAEVEQLKATLRAAGVAVPPVPPVDEDTRG